MMFLWKIKLNVKAEYKLDYYQNVNYNIIKVSKKTMHFIYLFMSAFEHHRKGTMTNQIFPVELKLPD